MKFSKTEINSHREGGKKFRILLLKKGIGHERWRQRRMNRDFPEKRSQKDHGRIVGGLQ